MRRGGGDFIFLNLTERLASCLSLVASLDARDETDGARRVAYRKLLTFA
jgi:hypothetical protein